MLTYAENNNIIKVKHIFGIPVNQVRQEMTEARRMKTSEPKTTIMPDGSEAQFVICRYGSIPSWFRLPVLDEMSYGKERCDHHCDVEHLQQKDNEKLLTCIMWTTDGGYGLFPEGTIGCQWIASIFEYIEPLHTFDVEWHEIAELVLDCEAGTDEAVARQTCHRLLSENLEQMQS